MALRKNKSTKRNYKKTNRKSRSRKIFRRRLYGGSFATDAINNIKNAGLDPKDLSIQLVNNNETRQIGSIWYRVIGLSRYFELQASTNENGPWTGIANYDGN